MTGGGGRRFLQPFARSTEAQRDPALRDPGSPHRQASPVGYLLLPESSRCCVAHADGDSGHVVKCLRQAQGPGGEGGSRYNALGTAEATLRCPLFAGANFVSGSGAWVGTAGASAAAQVAGGSGKGGMLLSMLLAPVSAAGQVAETASVHGLVINDPSISGKVHAHVVLQPVPRPRSSKQAAQQYTCNITAHTPLMCYLQAGSPSVPLSSDALIPRQQVAVSSGDYLRLGDVEGRLFFGPGCFQQEEASCRNTRVAMPPGSDTPSRSGARLPLEVPRLANVALVQSNGGMAMGGGAAAAAAALRIASSLLGQSSGLNSLSSGSTAAQLQHADRSWCQSWLQSNSGASVGAGAGAGVSANGRSRGSAAGPLFKPLATVPQPLPILQGQQDASHSVYADGTLAPGNRRDADADAGDGAVDGIALGALDSGGRASSTSGAAWPTMLSRGSMGVDGLLDGASLDGTALDAALLTLGLSEGDEEEVFLASDTGTPHAISTRSSSSTSSNGGAGNGGNGGAVVPRGARAPAWSRDLSGQGVQSAPEFERGEAEAAGFGADASWPDSISISGPHAPDPPGPGFGAKLKQARAHARAGTEAGFRVDEGLVSASLQPLKGLGQGMGMHAHAHGGAFGMQDPLALLTPLALQQLGSNSSGGSGSSCASSVTASSVGGTGAGGTTTSCALPWLTTSGGSELSTATDSGVYRAYSSDLYRSTAPALQYMSYRQQYQQQHWNWVAAAAARGAPGWGVGSLSGPGQGQGQATSMSIPSHLSHQGSGHGALSCPGAYISGGSYSGGYGSGGYSGGYGSEAEGSFSSDPPQDESIIFSWISTRRRVQGMDPLAAWAHQRSSMGLGGVSMAVTLNTAPSPMAQRAAGGGRGGGGSGAGGSEPSQRQSSFGGAEAGAGSGLGGAPHSQCALDAGDAAAAAAASWWRAVATAADAHEPPSPLPLLQFAQGASADFNAAAEAEARGRIWQEAEAESVLQLGGGGGLKGWGQQPGVAFALDGPSRVAAAAAAALDSLRALREKQRRQRRYAATRSAVAGVLEEEDEAAD